MFGYHLTKNVFYDEMISIKRCICVQSFIKFRDKKFFGPKNTKGVSKPSKFFGSTKKKKKYLTNVVEPANRSQHTKLFRVQVFSF